VNDLQKSFVELWERETKGKIEDKDLYPQQKPVGNVAMRALEGTNEGGINPLYVTFLSAISCAESNVHITMAYFVPDVQLIDALKDAAKRGVDVKLILPAAPTAGSSSMPGARSTTTCWKPA
jgi:cardiolipin synthase